jgi:hypothetical protein
MIANRRPTDVAFRHFAYRRVHMQDFSRRYPGKVLGREGVVFIFSRSDLYLLNFHAGADRHAVQVEWTHCVSPYAPIRVYTVMFKHEPGRDQTSLTEILLRYPMQKDWILYMQARTAQHYGNSIVDLSVGKWVYHFFDAEEAHAYLEQMIPSL